MKLYVIRHGQTQANLEHRYLGALDPDLTDHGRQQAQALRGQLPANLDAILTSPLQRARQTAEILNQQLQRPLRVNTQFRERNVGVFEGLTQAEARERYPHLWARNITRQWDAAPDGGETIKDVAYRVREGLIELSKDYQGKTLVLVAHGFVAKTVRALARDDFSDYFDWQLNNGQVLELEDVTVGDLPSGLRAVAV
ncbi:histidine phosphatase family protein [Pseudomonas sp. 3A(2025)]